MRSIASCVEIPRDEAIANLVACLGGDAFARLDYRPEPTTGYALEDIAKLSALAKRDANLGPEERRAVTAWSAWRSDVTLRRSQNEARLSTLLWALDVGDDFAKHAVASFLREQWHVFDPPTRGDREAFCRRVCAIECRAGALSL